MDRRFSVTVLQQLTRGCAIDADHTKYALDSQAKRDDIHIVNRRLAAIRGGDTKMTNHPNRRKAQIFSIFSQIDGVIADMMVSEGKATKIEQCDIPASALFDDDGRKAFFAIILPVKHLGEFNRRARDLRA